MRKLREILRLRLSAQLSMRQIRDSLRLSLGAVQKVTSKAHELGLDWEAIEKLDDRELAKAIYPESDTRTSGSLQLPDWKDAYKELHFKHVTKHLLWEEYAQQYPNRSYSYPQYCHLYREWLRKQKRSMCQIHKAGDKLFVDYAGQTVPIVQGDTGEVRFAQIFVAVLGASNYTFVEATWTQSLPDWLASHARAFAFIGGVPKLVV
ncbi:MAG: transposase, partial [Gammaproteobacteria bacterium]|nr:transposase [Gammaproteobacteria bacterium]